MKIINRIISITLILTLLFGTQVPEISAKTAALKEVKKSGGTATSWVSPKLANPTWSGTPGADGSVSTWNCVYFGHYLQSDTTGDGTVNEDDQKQPIKWRVLSVDGDDVFLLADRNLDVKLYNETRKDITWEDCTIRSWLNGYGADSNSDGYGYSETDANFLDTAFSSDEQKLMKTTAVTADINSVYPSVDVGNDTQDSIYLLSISEVSKPEYGFNSIFDNMSNTRVSVNTGYSASINQQMSREGTEDYWLLRSFGGNSNRAANVTKAGQGNCYGNYVNCNYIAVRPALHLNLSSLSATDLVTYAGTVSSDGTTLTPCKKPVASVASGTYSDTKTVTLTTETAGANIYYTTDGSEPTEDNAILYNAEEPLTISSTTIVKAVTVPASGQTWLMNSMTATYEYRFIGKSQNGQTLMNPTWSGTPGENGSVSTWDCVYFGNYLQGDTNGDGTVDASDEKQPIKWRVLSVDDDDVFLLADQNLDDKPYNETIKEMTWEVCTLRSWFNGYGTTSNLDGRDYSATTDNFLDVAFSSEEQKLMKTTTVTADGNSEYPAVSAGNATQDLVSLLSIQEVSDAKYGFNSSFYNESGTRVAVNTRYVSKNWEMKAEGTADNWWLRSHGEYGTSAVFVGLKGLISCRGTNVWYGILGNRPALHLKLSSLSSTDLVSYAGTVSSDGTTKRVAQRSDIKTESDITVSYDGNPHGVMITPIDDTQTPVPIFEVTYKKTKDGAGEAVAGQSASTTEPTDAGTYQVYAKAVTDGGSYLKNSSAFYFCDLTIEQIEKTTIETPDAVAYQENLKLSDVELEGDWEWVKPDTSLNVPGGTYDVIYNGTDKENYISESCSTSTVVTVQKGSQTAPSDLLGVNVTKQGEADGKVTGVSTLMEYSTDPAFSETLTNVCEGTEIIGLSAGTYYVRYQETDNYHASEAVSIMILDGSAASPAPTTTTTPKPTESAAPTQSPKPTESAVPTQSPTPTVSPKVTSAPKPTMTPTVTPSPQPTTSPILDNTKKIPSYKIPSALKAAYGTKLKSVKLPSGFTWKKPSQPLNKRGTKTFKATYTPKDTTNYKVVKNIRIKVKVTKASVKKAVIAKKYKLKYHGNKLKQNKDYTLYIKFGKNLKWAKQYALGKGNFKGKKLIRKCKKVTFHVRGGDVFGRSAPSPKAAVIVAFEKDSKVSVVPGKIRRLPDASAWYQVKYNGKICWVYSKYLKFD